MEGLITTDGEINLGLQKEGPKKHKDSYRVFY